MGRKSPGLSTPTESTDLTMLDACIKNISPQPNHDSPYSSTSAFSNSNRDSVCSPFLTLHSSSSSNFQMNFARSRHLSYRWYDSLLCSVPLVMVYNVTPWYHGWSNSTTVHHSNVHGDLPTSFYDRPGAFLGNVFDQDTRRPWERRSIVHHRQQLF